MRAIRDHYLGVKEQRKRVAKPSEKFSRIFMFDWEAGDDTAKNDANPLFKNRVRSLTHTHPVTLTHTQSHSHTNYKLLILLL